MSSDDGSVVPLVLVASAVSLSSAIAVLAIFTRHAHSMFNSITLVAVLGTLMQCLEAFWFFLPPFLYYVGSPLGAYGCKVLTTSIAGTVVASTGLMGILFMHVYQVLKRGPTDAKAYMKVYILVLVVFVVASLVYTGMRIEHREVGGGGRCHFHDERKVDILIFPIIWGVVIVCGASAVFVRVLLEHGGHSPLMRRLLLWRLSYAPAWALMTIFGLVVHQSDATSHAARLVYAFLGTLFPTYQQLIFFVTEDMASVVRGRTYDPMRTFSGAVMTISAVFDGGYIPSERSESHNETPTSSAPPTPQITFTQHRSPHNRQNNALAMIGQHLDE